MDKKNLMIMAVVAIAVIAILAAVFLTQNNNSDKDSDEGGDVVPEPVTYDYYIYLDGMGDVNGWYTSKATNSLDGFKNALDGKVEYVVDNGFIKSIAGNVGDSSTSTGFGIFYYTSASLDYKTADYFFAFAAIDKIPGNIIYITYSTYTFDENFIASYSVNPKTNETLMSTGPFAEGVEYSAIPYSAPSWFYLDGIEGYNGWYQGSGTSTVESFKNAMETGKVPYALTEDGWISYVGSEDNAGTPGLGYSVYLYGSNSVANAWKYGFFNGPGLADVVSNYVYISYGAWSYDSEAGAVYYAVNPYINDEIVKGGPFAAVSVAE